MELLGFRFTNILASDKQIKRILTLAIVLRKFVLGFMLLLIDNTITHTYY